MLRVWHTPPTNAENHRVRGIPGADLIQPQPPPPFILGTKSQSQDKGPATHSVGVLAKMQTGQRSFEQTLLWLPSSCFKSKLPGPIRLSGGRHLVTPPKWGSCHTSSSCGPVSSSPCPPRPLLPAPLPRAPSQSGASLPRTWSPWGSGPSVLPAGPQSPQWLQGLMGAQVFPE